MKALIGIQVSVLAFVQAVGAEEKPHDLVIYGGSSAAIAAAIQVKKMGGSVIIIEPTDRIGGLTTGGLGQTDIGNKQVIGGISREFYREVKRWYARPEAWKAMPQPKGNFKGDGQTITDPDEDSLWSFEPSAALGIFRNWVKEHGLEIIHNERLDRRGEGRAVDRGDGYWVAKPGSVAKGVVKEGNRITAIVMESGRTFAGRAFMDATYEGDLMAAAGVSFTIGREGRAIHGETLNGVQTVRSRWHQMMDGVDPYVKPGDPSSGLVFGIDPEGPGEEYGSDHRSQAFCFRMCLTDHEPNRVPFAKPEGYEEGWYELLFRNYEAGYKGLPWINSTMPNRKTDTNNRNGVSTDFIGQNYGWPQGTYEERSVIRAKHLLYQQGLMWTLANHPRIPQETRQAISNWGVTKDEFTEGGGWQQQLYIREGRRMISGIVMTQDHCQQVKVEPDSVGMGAYNMDSHNTQRYVTKEGFVRNEGDVQVRVKPYPISYRSIIPREEEASNLVVPVALGSSHIAFGSIRMEPVFMILGQSGATAVVHSIRDGVPLQKVDYAKLRERLLADHQVLEHASGGGSLPSKGMKGIIMDDEDARLEGSWTKGGASGGVDAGYRHDRGAKDGKAKATYVLKAGNPGKYKVQISAVPEKNRAGNTLVKVDGVAYRLDQRSRPTVDDVWVPVAEVLVEKAGDVTVVITNEAADGHVVADAVRLLPVK